MITVNLDRVAIAVANAFGDEVSESVVDIIRKYSNVELVSVSATPDQWGLVIHALNRWCGNSMVSISPERRVLVNDLFDRIKSANTNG